MSITVRKNSDELVIALAYALNSLQTYVVEDGYTVVHRDLTQTTSPIPLLPGSGITLTTVTVNAPTAVDLPSTVVLTNQLLGVLNQHMFEDQVHLLKDFVNQPNMDGYMSIQANLFTDGGLAACEVNLNAMKALFTAHLTATGIHVNNDGQSYGLPANATNLATAETLANALASAVNTHMGKAGPNINTPRIRMIEV